jgi:hypothetical protein
MKAKISIIFIISMFAFLSTSIAYSLWTEEITIWADIHTGTVDVEWTYNGYTMEQENPDSFIDGFITYWDLDKPDELNCLKLDIYNPIPSVFYYVYFDISCIGTIPVHFTDWEIDTNMPYDCYQYDLSLVYIKNIDGEIIVDTPTPIDEIQLHEGETAYFVLWFYFDECIDSQTTYNFYLHTMEYQFNLEPVI